jgi:hypothetical protein
MMQQRFDALMQKDVHRLDQTEQMAKDPNKIASPMDEATKMGGRTGHTGKIRPAEIIEQTRSASRRIETIKTRLGGANVDVKPSVQGLLRNKLHHIDRNIQGALDKAGAQESDKMIAKEGEVEMVDGVLNPVHRFLGMLTSGQSSLEQLTGAVERMNKEGNASPSALLAIQIKVSRAQHEIELFTSLLNKALESTKTIMNVQV